MLFINYLYVSYPYIYAFIHKIQYLCKQQKNSALYIT